MTLPISTSNSNGSVERQSPEKLAPIQEGHHRPISDDGKLAVGNDVPLTPEPLPQPPRRVDLSPVNLSLVPDALPVESLRVREMKGIGSTFTPNLSTSLTFKGIVYTPSHGYEKEYHLLGKNLLAESRLAAHIQAITFTAALDWSTCDVVLMPIKATRLGRLVMQDLVKEQPHFSHRKYYIEWVQTKRRHVLNQAELTGDEIELLGKAHWPTQEEIIGALQVTAFDNLNELVEANAEVRLIINSREVS